MNFSQLPDAIALIFKSPQCFARAGTNEAASTLAVLDNQPMLQPCNLLLLEQLMSKTNTRTNLYEYESKSSDSVHTTYTTDGTSVKCTCRGFTNHGKCWHVVDTATTNNLNIAGTNGEKTMKRNTKTKQSVTITFPSGAFSKCTFTVTKTDITANATARDKTLAEQRADNPRVTAERLWNIWTETPNATPGEFADRIKRAGSKATSLVTIANATKQTL